MRLKWRASHFLASCEIYKHRKSMTISWYSSNHWEQCNLKNFQFPCHLHDLIFPSSQLKFLWLDFLCFLEWIFQAFPHQLQLLSLEENFQHGFLEQSSKCKCSTIKVLMILSVFLPFHIQVDLQIHLFVHLELQIALVVHLQVLNCILPTPSL